MSYTFYNTDYVFSNFLLSFFRLIVATLSSGSESRKSDCWDQEDDGHIQREEGCCCLNPQLLSWTSFPSIINYVLIWRNAFEVCRASTAVSSITSTQDHSLMEMVVCVWKTWSYTNAQTLVQYECRRKCVTKSNMYHNRGIYPQLHCVYGKNELFPFV